MINIVLYTNNSNQMDKVPLEKSNRNIPKYALVETAIFGLLLLFASIIMYFNDITQTFKNYCVVFGLLGLLLYIIGVYAYNYDIEICYYDINIDFNEKEILKKYQKIYYDNYKVKPYNATNLDYSPY